jgi:glycosyltransferase involved in cell wall biosynthesis
MKVVQIHNFYKDRGGECGVVEAQRRLLEEHGNIVLQFAADSGEIGRMPLLQQGLNYLQIPWNSGVAQRLFNFVHKHRPDVAHVHNVFPLFSPSVYQALSQAGVPVVQTVHNYRFLCPNGLFYINGEVCEACQDNGYWEAVRNRCMHGNVATSALYAAAIAWGWRSGIFQSCIDRHIALNAFVAGKLMAAGVPEEKIHICGNFVGEFAEVTAAKKRYALYLGRLSSEKGLTTLLAAARLVPELSLKIAGTGPLEDNLRRLIDEPDMGHIELIGYVSGEIKRCLIAEALCTVVPSECYENFPLSLAESLSLGTPVIASRIGGLPELIEHHRTGLLFSAGNVEALADCLRWMSRNASDAREMAAIALVTARERFSPQRHFEQLMEIYDDTVSEHRKTHDMQAPDVRDFPS